MKDQKKIRWFRRSGQRISEKKVIQAQQNYVEAKRTGNMGCLKCSIQLKMADSIEAMSLIEFANWSGQFTYKFVEKN